MDEKFQEMISDIKEIQPFFYGNIAEMFIAKGYRKESDTAREILTELVKRAEKLSFFDCRMGLDLDELAQKYGVDLGE